MKPQRRAEQSGVASNGERGTQIEHQRRFGEAQFLSHVGEGVVKDLVEAHLPVERIRVVEQHPKMLRVAHAALDPDFCRRRPEALAQGSGPLIKKVEAGRQASNSWQISRSAADDGTVIGSGVRS